MSVETIQNAIRDVVDFPKEGIVYKDITPLLKDPKIFQEITDLFTEKYKDQEIDYVVGVESRGFIFGAPLALNLGCGFIPARKKGKLPYTTIEESYDLEYGSATLELHTDAIEKGKKVVIIDDLLATGGTVNAVAKLIERLGGDIVGIDFLIGLTFLPGKEVLSKYDVNSLIEF